MSTATTLEVLIQIREDLAGLSKARTELQGAKKDAGALGDAIKQGLGIGTGMQLVTAAISALKSGLQSTVGEAIKMAGELKDTSEALGIDTTMLQVLRLEMRAAGMDIGRLSLAVTAQNKSLAEARDAGSGAAQAYRTLGLEASKIERLTTAERILAVVRAYNAATDKSLAFSAASQVLGDRDLPRLLAALQRLATDGGPALESYYKAMGLITSDDAINRIDKTQKRWELALQKIRTGFSEGTNAALAYHEATTKAVSGDMSGAGAAARDANASDSWGAKLTRRLVSGENMPLGMRMAGMAIQSLGLVGLPPATPAAESATPAGAATTTTVPSNSVSREDYTAALKTSQAELAAILDKSATSEANEALTAEEKAAAKHKALEAEVVARKQIVDLLGQTQQLGDFREQSEKDAEMLKAKGGLQRAQNALAAQGNTAAQQQARQLFELETQAIAAEAAGNTKLAEQKREQVKALQLTAQLEGQQPALVQARIAAERQLTAAQHTRAKAEQDFSRAIGQLDQEMALIDADNALTERERQAKLIPLLEQKNKLTADHIALLEQDTRLQQGDQTSLDLQKTIDELRKQLSEGQAKVVSATGPETRQMRDDKALRDMGIGTNADGTPAKIDSSQHYQSVEAGAAGGGKSFIAQIGTDGDIAAASINEGLNSALSTTSNWLYNLASGAMTWHDAMQSAIASIGQSFLRMVTDMVAKILWRSTVERALVWLGVTTHVQGEATKTAATTTGVGMRVLLGIKEALVSVYKGALYAFEALANIPYVGPFLGAAAMAAAIAGGIALVGKMGAFEEGGIVRGGRQVIQVNENGIESVLNARATALLGADGVAALNAGNIASLAALLGSDVTGGIAAPVLAMQQAASISNGNGVAADEAPQVHVAFGAFNNQQHAQNWLESQAGECYLINFLKRRGAKFDR